MLSFHVSHCQLSFWLSTATIIVVSALPLIRNDEAAHARIHSGVIAVHDTGQGTFQILADGGLSSLKDSNTNPAEGRSESLPSGRVTTETVLEQTSIKIAKEVATDHDKIELALQRDFAKEALREAVKHSPTQSTRMSFSSKDDSSENEMDLQRFIQTDMPKCSDNMTDWLNVSKKLHDAQASHWNNVFADARANVVNGSFGSCQLFSPEAKAPFFVQQPSNHIVNYYSQGEKDIKLPPCVNSSSKASAPPERQIMTLANGQLRSYALLLPPSGACSTEKKCPLTVWLAGEKEDHGPWEKEFSAGPVWTLPYVALFPDCLQQMGTALLMLNMEGETPNNKCTQWDGPGEIDEFVMVAVRKVLKEKADIFDPSRVRIAGYSTGGAASILAAARYPDIFEKGIGLQACSHSFASAPLSMKRARPDGISPGDAMPKQLQGLILGMNGLPTCFTNWSTVLNQSSWLADTPVQVMIFPNAGHDVWGIMLSMMFNAIFKDTPDRRLAVWGTLFSLLLLSIAPVWTRIRASSEEAEESPEAMLANFDDLDSLDRTVTTNKFVSMSQQSLYGVAMIMVCLSHWLPHDLSGLQMSTWSRSALGLIAASHTTMSLVFTLTGYANSVSEKSNRLGKREGLLLAIYLLMAWPLALNLGIAVYHRWTLLWLIIFKVVLCLFELVRVPPLVQICLAFAAAYPLAGIPDSIHSLLPVQQISDGISASVFRDPSLILVNEFFFWSLGHKVYWFGLYLTGHHYGPRLSPLLQKHPDVFLKLLQRNVRCCTALGLLTVWVLQRFFSRPYDPDAPLAMADWPDFFTPRYMYPLNLFLDVAQLVLLMLTVGVGNVVLQTCGQGVLGTYVTHAYINLEVFELATKSTVFASLRVVPIWGGFLQLAIIVAFPITYAITIGLGSKYLLLGTLRVAIDEKPLQRIAEVFSISKRVEQLSAICEHTQHRWPSNQS